MFRILLPLFLLRQLLVAETFVREYTYNAGDSDSKLTARKAAMRQIQFQVIEEVGVSIRSQYAKQEDLQDETYKKAIQTKYESFAQAITKTKILKEKWDGKSFYLKAEVEVDPQDLSKVFEEVLPQDEHPAPKASGPCETAESQAASMLTDLSSQEKKNTILDFSMSHPIDTACNKWQINVIRTLGQYGVSSNAYRDFLLKSMQSFKQIDKNDERGVAILGHLSRIHPFTIDDIDAVATLLIKSDVSWILDYFSLVLRNSEPEAGEEYISRILGALDSKKLGIPVSMDSAYVSTHLTDLLYRLDNDLFEYLYELDPFFIRDNQDDKRFLALMTNRYLKHRSSKTLTNMLSTMKSVKPSCDISLEYLRSIRNIIKKSGGISPYGYLKKEKEETTPYFKDFAQIIKETLPVRQAFTMPCKEDFSGKIQLTLAPYLILNKIDAPDKPSPQQCAAMLFSGDKSYIIDRYAEYLRYYGDESKAAKPQIVEGLKKYRLSKDLYDSVMVKNILPIVQNINTYDDAFVDYLVNVIVSPNTDGKSRQMAKDILLSYGSKGIDRLLYNYPQDHYYKSERLVNLFIEYPLDTSTIKKRLKALPRVDSMHDRIIDKTLKKLSN